MDTLTPEAIEATGIFDARGDPVPDTRSYGKAHQCRISLMGPADAVPVDEAMEGGSGAGRGNAAGQTGSRAGYQVIVALVAALIFLGCVVSPPSLMDDVDAVQAQIARNMLQSGDWVTARLDGIAYLEKSPLKYWMMAVSLRDVRSCTTGRRGFRLRWRRCCCAG